MNILSTHDLTKIYGNGDNEVHALSHVSLDIEEGTFVSIIGSSGSGKSTLLNLLGGLDRPTSGEVIVDGKSIFEMRDEELTIFRRRKIGFVFQNYNLMPILNVYENIVLPIDNLLDNAVKYGKPGNEIVLAVRELGLTIEISVTDQNEPISGEERTRIFERFYRGKNAIEKEGVGIGLYLAREIIEKQGGCLSVHPAGQGNRFSIVLPKQLPDR